MNHRINNDRTAAVSLNTEWIPIDEHTPRGVKLQLINKTAGVAQYGRLTSGDTFYTHWYPAPKFKKD